VDGIMLRDLVEGVDDASLRRGVPLLIVKAPSGIEQAPTPLDTPGDGLPLDSTAYASHVHARGYIAPGAVVVPIMKTGRSKFTSAITVGRSNRSDIILMDQHVSQLHGWFIEPGPGGGPWRYRDNSSTNGSFVNRRQLPIGAAANLVAADEVRFATVDSIFIEAGMLTEIVDYARETWRRLGI